MQPQQQQQRGDGTTGHAADAAYAQQLTHLAADADAASQGHRAATDAVHVHIDTSPSAAASATASRRHRSAPLRHRRGLATMSKVARGFQRRQTGMTSVTDYIPRAVLRRIFRRMDRDRDGAISPVEFRQGLRALGFDITNLAALNALQREIDVDQSGVLRESEFLEAFRRFGRNALNQKLAGGEQLQGGSGAAAIRKTTQTRACSVMIVDYWRDAKQKQHFQKRHVPLDALSKVLIQPVPRPDSVDANHVRWIDVCGVDSDVVQLIANEYNLPDTVLEDVLYDHRSKAEFYPATDPAHSVQIVLPILTTSKPPLSVEKGKLELSEGRGRKPVLSRTQLNLFVIGKHVVLTFRPAPVKVDLRRDSVNFIPLGVNTGHNGVHASKPGAHAGDAYVSREHADVDGVGDDEANAASRRGSLFGDTQETLGGVARNLLNRLPVMSLPLLGNSRNHGNKYDWNATSLRVKAEAFWVHILAEVETRCAPHGGAYFEEERELHTHSDECVNHNDLSLGIFMDAPSFACELMDEVVEFNWKTIDMLKDWITTVEGSIRESVKSWHLTHVLDLQQLSSLGVTLLSPSAETLSIITGLRSHVHAGAAQPPEAGAHGQGAGGSGVHTMAAGAHGGRPRMNVGRRSTEIREHDGVGHGRAASSWEYPPPLELESSVAVFPRAQLFFTHAMEDLRDVHASISRQFSDINHIKELANQLASFYSKRTDDKMQSTLYVLTLVTTSLAPTQLMSSIYGMNFENMPELSWKPAYYVFWGFNIVMIGLILLWFRRRQMFF